MKDRVFVKVDRDIISALPSQTIHQDLNPNKGTLSDGREVVRAADGHWYYIVQERL